MTRGGILMQHVLITFKNLEFTISEEKCGHSTRLVNELTENRRAPGAIAPLTSYRASDILGAQVRVKIPQFTRNVLDEPRQAALGLILYAEFY